MACPINNPDPKDLPGDIAPTSMIARAKINLCLHVLDKSTDGFHQLQSLVVFADIGDKISTRARSGGSDLDELHIDGPFAKSLLDAKDNIVLKALAEFKKRWPDAVSKRQILHLTKNLPVASGIGGGSANAATTLELLAKISKVKIAQEQLLQVAAKLGSDVPVCLSGLSTIMSGRGEILSPLKSFPQIFAVLVNPNIAVSTRQIFAMLNNVNNPSLPKIPLDFSHPVAVFQWLKLTRNDLDEAANQLVPQIGKITKEFQANPHCAFSRMSGSGATVFGLFENADQAKNCAVAMRKKWPDYWVQSTIFAASP